MTSIFNRIKKGGLYAVLALGIFSACNKGIDELPEATPVASTAKRLSDTLRTIPNDSLYYKILVRANWKDSINFATNTFTMFVPDNNAVRIFVNAASGGLVPLNAPEAAFVSFINSSLPVSSAAAIVKYYTTPQLLPSANFGNTFPNRQLPSIYNPSQDPAFALLRLSIFPSQRNGNWINNIPLTAVDLRAGNGIIHHMGALVSPPSKYLWDRINTDAGLTYLKAAILRADSGTGTVGTLQSALLNIGANLTVFAPTDAAFQATLTGAIYQGLLPLVTAQLTAAYIAAGQTPTAAAAAAAINAPPLALSQATTLASSPTVFTNPALYGVLTAQTVKGIVVYHILGVRAFTNNFPTTQTFYPTLLNSAIPTHPGIGLVATFGTPFATSAKVKGVGNATAANIIINATPLLPDPAGTSDQHYLNGVLHKIDQVLLPQ